MGLTKLHQTFPSMLNKFSCKSTLLKALLFLSLSMYPVWWDHLQLNQSEGPIWIWLCFWHIVVKIQRPSQNSFCLISLPPCLPGPFILLYAEQNVPLSSFFQMSDFFVLTLVVLVWREVVNNVITVSYTHLTKGSFVQTMLLLAL